MMQDEARRPDKDRFEILDRKGRYVWTGSDQEEAFLALLDAGKYEHGLQLVELAPGTAGRVIGRSR